MCNNFCLISHYVCNGQEKERLWETVQKMIEVIQAVRREGLLYLDVIADREEDLFLRSCFRYITEADPTPRMIREYVSIFLATEVVSAFRRLEMATIGNGLEQLLLQSTPSAALRHLGAWLGVEFADRVEVAVAAMNRVQHKNLAESLEPSFDRLLILSNEQLSAALEQADDVIISLALMGAGEAIAERLKSALSSERWRQMKGVDVSYPRACDVLEAQLKILSIADDFL